MASTDDVVVEGSFSSVLIDSLKLSSGEVLSAEELAWVDSCLVSDPNTSDDDWSSVKDALIEILGLQPDSHNTAVIASSDDSLFVGTDVEMLPSTETRIVEFRERTNDDFVSVETNIVTEERNYDFPSKEETSISLTEHLQGDNTKSPLRNVFLPNYKYEEEDVGEFVDSGSGIGYSTPEQSKQDIFKVWDLELQSEEDELVNLWNKALSGGSVKSVPLLADDSGAWKDLKAESVDDLISSISDLSLK
ncbi:uncharacterized protein LOC126679936 [Mercurialis annua]|uniref:uncharacterized protein LOC126679936 n=1 Tax=Mercurialis annua TaxID=3986 RepID=UPI0021601966|nr:uncharacterized protein LOC126679936 [Mercurialis annua]